MKKGKASWTAEITAVLRATESIKPLGIRLLHDQYAARFLRPTFRFILRSRFIAEFLLWLMIDRRFPGAIDTTVSRIRFIDDCLRSSIDEGFEQLVILGAGYDSRAYRFAELKGKRVFEVDHPNTQKLKKDKMKKIFGDLPDHVVFVPVDFEKDALMSTLIESGYRKDLKTLFVWEAVCKYLTPNAVSDLLVAVSSNTCQGSSIVFDYLFQSMLGGESTTPLNKKIVSFQAQKGEPYIFGLPEKNPEGFLMERGFTKVISVAAENIKKKYYSAIARGKNMHLSWGVIQATV